MLLHRWILALQITTLPAICLEIKNVETRTSLLFLAEDGKLLDSKNLPNCGPVKKIILKSYTYNKMICTSANCTSVHEDKMANSTALQLHQNCSLRQSCETLHFPAPISLPNRSDNLLAVTIKYQCTDDQRSILNMCERHKMNFTDTLHLTFNSHTKNSENCVCGVNKGAFSLTIEDIRLKSWNEDMCSAAKFVINRRQITCDPESDSYGAIFGETIQDMPSEAYIELSPNSDNKLPEMIWIRVTPEVSSRLECYGDHVSSEKSTGMVKDTKQGLTTKYVADVVDTSESLHKIVTTTDGSSMDGTNDQAGMVSTVTANLYALVVLVLVVAFSIFLYRCIHMRTRKQRKRRTVVRQPSDSRHDNTPGTSDIKKKLGDVRRKSTVTAENEENETNTDDGLTDCKQPLVQDKLTQSRQKSLPGRTDVEETLYNNKNVPKAESSNDGEILLSDESVRFIKVNTDEPVQESGQNGKGDSGVEGLHSCPLSNNQLTVDLKLTKKK